MIKVTPEMVASIKADLEAGLKPKQIAEKNGYAIRFLYNVISRFKIGVKHYQKKEKNDSPEVS